MGKCEKSDYKKEFCALMDKFAYRYSRWQVWNDFLTMSAISLANVVPGPEKEKREETYLSVINSYPKEEQEVFPEMLGIVVQALSDNPEQDFFLFPLRFPVQPAQCFKLCFCKSIGIGLVVIRDKNPAVTTLFCINRVIKSQCENIMVYRAYRNA